MTGANPQPRRCVAFVNLYTEMGGGEYTAFNLVKEIDKTRFRPIMFFGNNGEFVQKVRSLGVETSLFPYQAVMLRRLANPAVLWRTIRASGEVYRLFKSENVALVHCSDVLALVLVAYPVLRLRLPVVYSIIFFYEWSRMLLFNLIALMIVDRIIVSSNMVKLDLSRRTLFLKRKSETVRNGIDVSLFRPIESNECNVLRKELNVASHTRLVGMVGRFDPAKGHAVFLRAAARLLQTDTDVLFVVIGGLLGGDVIPPLRSYQREIMNESQRLELGDRVRFLGNRNDMPEVMRSLDLLVCPSHSEGFGLVILEGLASGVPVVLNSAVGALEIVSGLPGVYVATVGNPVSYAERITEALAASKPGTAGGIRRAAETKLRECTWPAYARRVEYIYSSLEIPSTP